MQSYKSIINRSLNQSYYKGLATTLDYLYCKAAKVVNAHPFTLPIPFVTVPAVMTAIFIVVVIITTATIAIIVVTVTVTLSIFAYYLFMRQSDATIFLKTVPNSIQSAN